MAMMSGWVSIADPGEVVTPITSGNLRLVCGLTEYPCRSAVDPSEHGGVCLERHKPGGYRRPARRRTTSTAPVPAATAAAAAPATGRIAPEPVLARSPPAGDGLDDT